MKTFLTTILSLVLGTAFAAPPVTVKVEQNPGGYLTRNYIRNPGAEQNDTLGITDSSNIASRTTTTPIEGVAEFTVDASSSGQQVDWATNTLQQGMKTGNCEAQMVVEGDASLYKIQIRQGSSVAAELQLSNYANPTLVSLNAPCGDLSGATVVRMESTSASAASITVDSVYYGRATNVGTLSPQPTIFGTLTQAGNSGGGCNFTRLGTNASLGDVGTGTNCSSWTATGSVTSVSSTDIDITLTNAPAGEYEIELIGGLGFTTTTASSCFLAFNDGTNTFGKTKIENIGTNSSHLVSNMIGHINYTTAGTRTITLQAASSGVVNCGANNDNAVGELKWIVKRFPSQSELAYKPSSAPFLGKATWVGGAGKVFNNTNSTWTTVSDTDFATRTNSGAAQDPSSTSDLAVKIPSLPAGTYYVYANGQNYGISSVNCYVSIFDGTNNLFVTAGPSVPYIGGFVTYTSAGDKTFTLQTRSGTGTCVTEFDTSTYEGFEIGVIPVSQGLPAPVLVGSVTSNSTGAERIERARVTTTCSGSPCTIASQSGSWLSSITRTGTGQYTLNIVAGIFSAAPTCVFYPGNTSGPIGSRLSAASSTTAVSFLTFDNVFANIDIAFEALCMGPR